MLLLEFFPLPRSLGIFFIISLISGRFFLPALAFCPLVPLPEVLPRFPPLPTSLAFLFLFFLFRLCVCIPLENFTNNSLAYSTGFSLFVFFFNCHLIKKKFLTGQVFYLDDRLAN